MTTNQFIILLTFHFILWWVALSRAKLVFLPFSKDHPAPLYFAFAVLLQSLHAFILSFNPTAYFDQRFYNALAVVLIVVASHLFYLFGFALFKTAKDVDAEPISHAEMLLRKVETVIFVAALLCVFLLEYLAGGQTNNQLTPSAIDLLRDGSLLSSRLVTFAYVVFCEWALIRYIFLIFSTTYGNRITVKIRGWAGIISTFFISLHYIFNPLAALIIFFTFQDSQLAYTVKDIYSTFETYNVIPIAFFLLMATSPRRVISVLASLYLNFFYLMRLRTIDSLRDLLVRNFPDISLALSDEDKKGLSARSKITRSIVEISDGINLLLKYISPQESAKIITNGKNTGKNSYQIEADILLAALRSRESGSEMRPIPVTDVESLNAVSLTEITQCYYLIARHIGDTMKDHSPK